MKNYIVKTQYSEFTILANSLKEAVATLAENCEYISCQLVDEKKKALDWWNKLTIREKWDLFFKYNPKIGTSPANIGLRLEDVDDNHIKDIYIQEI